MNTIKWKINKVDPNVAQQYCDWAIEVLAKWNTKSMITIVETDDGREYPNIDIDGSLFPGYEAGAIFESGEEARNEAAFAYWALADQAIRIFGGAFL